MKKLNLLFLLSVCLVLSISSCSQDDDFINPAPQTRSVQLCKTRAEANSVLVNYLELVGDKYVLNISEKDAEAIGVPTDLYTVTLNEIKGTNELISKLKEDPKMELQLTDPQVALKTRSVWEQSTPHAALAPSGTLTTNGQKRQTQVWCGPLTVQKVLNFFVEQMRQLLQHTLVELTHRGHGNLKRLLVL